MLPEFDAKKIDSRLSGDILSHIGLYLIMLCIVGYYVITRLIPGHAHLTDLIWFGIAFGAIMFQSISRFLPVTKNWAAFNSGGIGALLIYNLAIYVLIIGFLPFYSPFLLVLPPLMFVTIYFRGTPSFLTMIATISVLVAVVTWKDGTPNVVGGHYYPFLTVLLAAAFGGIICRAGIIDTKLRDEFLRVSKGVELEKKQLDSVINSIKNIVIATNLEGYILFFNEAASSILGLDESSHQKKIQDLLALYNQQNAAVNLFSLLKKGLGQDLHLANVHILSKGKEKIDLVIDVDSLIPEENASNEGGYIFTLRDVTKEKTLDEERDEFISVTSHELRTPIAIVEGSLSMILDGKLTKNLNEGEIRDRLQKAYNSTLYLSNLTNQMAIISQLEGDELTTTFEMIDPVTLLNDLEKIFEEQAKVKDVQLLFSADLDLGKIRSSKIYVTEILQNFVSNAIKYTNKGTVTLQVTHAPKSPDILFSVEDTGIGISSADQPRLFAKFYRSEDYRTRETEGAGLGLFVSKMLVRNLGGKIWFTSAINKGSTFYLQIPNINENKDKNEVVSQTPENTLVPSQTDLNKIV